MTRSKLLESVRFEATAVVVIPPHGELPLDMLRYDACYLVHRNDRDASHGISMDLLGSGCGEWRHVVVGKLVRTATVRAFTPDRWASFGVGFRELGDYGEAPDAVARSVIAEGQAAAERRAQRAAARRAGMETSN